MAKLRETPTKLKIYPLHLYITHRFNAKCYQKRCLSDSGNGSRLPEGINDWSRGAPVGNKQNNVYIIQPFYYWQLLMYQLLVRKTLGDQTIRSDEIAGKPIATCPKRDVVRCQHCHGSTQTMPCHEQPQASQRWNMNHTWHPANLFSQSIWTRGSSAGVVSHSRNWPLFWGWYLNVMRYEQYYRAVAHM